MIITADTDGADSRHQFDLNELVRIEKTTVPVTW